MTNVELAKEGRLFGRGDFLGDNGDNFFELALIEQIGLMGWSHACPVIKATIEGYGGGEVGMKKTLKRYAECNFMFGLVKEAAGHNPDLLQQLTSPTTRLLPQEKVGHAEEGRAPNNHETEMSPLSTPAGYAIPRVLIEVIRSAGDNKELKAAKLMQVMQIIEDVVPYANNPSELVVKLAEAAVLCGADKKAVLSHLLPPGLLGEENCLTLMKKVHGYMPEFAPILNDEYIGILPGQHKELDIAEL